MGKGFRNIYLVPIYELLPGGSRLLSHQPEWKEDRKKSGGVLRGGTAKTFWETWAWRDRALQSFFLAGIARQIWLDSKLLRAPVAQVFEQRD